ncbi:hypothetical protein ASF10_13360 [Flavobacterium sp. Leaf82]|nr:hypothetical protein ASF10_13360 [Flavobacterium sp. Leaf82]
METIKMKVDQNQSSKNDNLKKVKSILRNQAPGFFRYALGELVVTAIYDGYVSLDPMSLSGITDQERSEDLAKQMLAPKGALDTSVNAFLVHDGERLILIDAGSAHFAGPSMGRLIDNIVASEYTPEDVDTILLTHMHPDHIGGITNDKGEALFPNAAGLIQKQPQRFLKISAYLSLLLKMQLLLTLPVESLKLSYLLTRFSLDM